MWYGAVAIIQGALVTAFLVPIVLSQVLLISLVCLLKDIVYSVYTLFYTRMIGPNVKCLLLLRCRSRSQRGPC